MDKLKRVTFFDVESIDDKEKASAMPMIRHLLNFVNYVFCVECPAIAFKCISYGNSRNYFCCQKEVLEDQIDNLARAMNDVGINTLDSEEFESDIDKDKLIWCLNMDIHKAVDICIDEMLNQKYRGIVFDPDKAFNRIFKEIYNVDLNNLESVS